jgi:hypothetical protein
MLDSSSEFVVTSASVMSTTSVPLTSLKSKVYSTPFSASLTASPTLRSSVHQAVVGGSSKWSDSDFLGESSKSGGKAKNYSKNKTQKQRKKAKGKEHGVKGGKVNKGGPKKGCHRYQGIHYLVVWLLLPSLRSS